MEEGTGGLCGLKGSTKKIITTMEADTAKKCASTGGNDACFVATSELETTGCVGCSTQATECGVKPQAECNSGKVGTCNPNTGAAAPRAAAPEAAPEMAMAPGDEPVMAEGKMMAEGPDAADTTGGTTGAGGAAVTPTGTAVGSSAPDTSSSTASGNISSSMLEARGESCYGTLLCVAITP
jgi:hypothetical protein